MCTGPLQALTALPSLGDHRLFQLCVFLWPFFRFPFGTRNLIQSILFVSLAFCLPYTHELQMPNFIFPEFYYEMYKCYYLLVLALV